MPAQPKTTEASGWRTPEKKFPRRRCDNCGGWYPLTKPNRKFCKEQCKNEFHQHGSAFGPLKQRIEKLIVKEVAARVGIEVERTVAMRLNTEALARAGFVHRSQLRGLFRRLKQLEAFASAGIARDIEAAATHQREIRKALTT